MATPSESSISAAINENILQCLICQSQFRKPKVLSCLHSFCTKCLKGWLKTKTNKTRIRCAICRKETILPVLGVDALAENYVIKDLVSLLEPKDSKPGSAIPEASNKKCAPTKKAPPKKAAAKPVVAALAKHKSKKNGEAIGPKAAKRRSMPIAANVDEGPSTSKRAKNANIAGQCSKKTSKVAEKSIARQCSKKTSKVAESSMAGQCSKKSTAEKKMRLDLEDDAESSSSSEDSDTSSDEDDEIRADDSELAVGSSEDSGDESGEESDVPATPTLTNYGEVYVGMKVYVISRKGKRVSATVKLLQECEIGASKTRRTYAGIELRRKHSGLVTDDLENIEGCDYLRQWLGENENPSTVVRADECLPAFYG